MLTVTLAGVLLGRSGDCAELTVMVAARRRSGRSDFDGPRVEPRPAGLRCYAASEDVRVAILDASPRAGDLVAVTGSLCVWGPRPASGSLREAADRYGVEIDRLAVLVRREVLEAANGEGKR